MRMLCLKFSFSGARLPTFPQTLTFTSMYKEPFTVQCIQKIPLCTMHTAHHLLHNVHCTPPTAQCTLHTTYCTLNIEQSTLTTPSRPDGAQKVAALSCTTADCQYFTLNTTHTENCQYFTLDNTVYTRHTEHCQYFTH